MHDHPLNKKVMAVYEKLSIYSKVTIGKNYKCYYCHRKGYTNKDHFYPKSQGGKLKVRSCKECNSLKGDSTPIEWLKIINKKLAHCELLQKDKKGCNYGYYIKSRCPDEDCPIRQKLIDMQQAIMILNDRVAWSFPKDTVKTYKKKQND
jgi:hypothetical protein